MRVIRATLKDDKAIIALAKESEYTKGFLEVYARISLEKLYAKSYVGIVKRQARVIGFVYSHHLVRKPYSSIYYMGVNKEFRNLGLGKLMVEWVLGKSPHSNIKLSCESDNTLGMKFYRTLGFKKLGSSVNKKGKELIYLGISK